MGHIAMKIYWDDNDDNHDSWSTNASELGLWSVKAWKNMPCKTSDWDIDGEKTWKYTLISYLGLRLCRTSTERYVAIPACFMIKCNKTSVFWGFEGPHPNYFGWAQCGARKCEMFVAQQFHPMLLLVCYKML